MKKISYIIFIFIIFCKEVNSEKKSETMDVFDIKIADLFVTTRYSDNSKIYTEYNLIDGLSDPWCSTDKGDIHFYFSKDKTITNIFIKNGFHKKSEYLDYNRIKKLEIYIDGKNYIIEVPDSPNAVIIPFESRFRKQSFYVRLIDFYYGNKYNNITCIGEIAFNKDQAFLESFNKSIETESGEADYLEYYKEDPKNWGPRFDQMKLLFINGETDQQYVFELKLEGIHENKSKGDASFYETFSPEYATKWKMDCSSWYKIDSNIFVNCNVKEDFSPGWIDKGDPGDHANKKLDTHFIHFQLGNPQWTILNNRKKPAINRAKMYIISGPILTNK
jgi:hypothetical protein